MSSNKGAKELLIKLYGPVDFIDALHLRKDTGNVKYKGKGQYKRMKQLTYHHIKMRSQGGKATVENGALLNAENHAWFHQQPKAEQEHMNQLFQEYKQRIDNGYEPCEIQLAPANEIELPVELDVLTASADNNQIKVHNKVRKKKNKHKHKRKNKRPVKRNYGRGER